MNDTENSPHNDIDHRKVIHDAIARRNYKRKIVNRVFTGVTIACVMIAMMPLGGTFCLKL